METGKVYKVALQPMTTSNYFAAGHRIRIEVSSSNFPRFDRNLNTGGNNYDEAKGVVAHNAVHHSRAVCHPGDPHGGEALKWEGAGDPRLRATAPVGTLSFSCAHRVQRVCRARRSPPPPRRGTA